MGWPSPRTTCWWPAIRRRPSRSSCCSPISTTSGAATPPCASVRPRAPWSARRGYMRDRVVGGRPIADLQGLQWKLADMAVAARGGPPAVGPGRAPGRARGDAAGPGDGHGQDGRQPGRQVGLRRGHPDPRRATATAASTRWSGPTGTSGACASAPARSRRSATTSAPVWRGVGPPTRPAGSRLASRHAGWSSASGRPCGARSSGRSARVARTSDTGNVVGAHLLVYREAPRRPGRNPSGRGVAPRAVALPTPTGSVRGKQRGTESRWSGQQPGGTPPESTTLRRTPAAGTRH